MRLILIWVIVFLIGTSLATLMLYDNGLVSMVWGDWVIETSVSFVLVGSVVLFAVGYFAIRLVFNIWNLPKFWQRSRRMRQYSKAETAMAKGLVALEYGDWRKAEKELIKSAKQSEEGLVHYLSAAKMAHNQKAYKRRDRYLTQAREAYIDDYVTIGLVEARLLSESEPELALPILEVLHEQAPENFTVLAELAQLLRKLERWNELGVLFPRLKQTRALDRAEQAELEKLLLAGKLTLVKDKAALEHLWSQLSPQQKLIPSVLAEYIEKSMGWGIEKGLSSPIERALKKQWDDRLVYQYGRISQGVAVDRLQVAEKWLKGHEENPVLLLTLGRLASYAQLWGRSQSYLKSSLQIRPEVETFHALAKCYEAEGQENQAALVYKDAILTLENAEKKTS